VQRSGSGGGSGGGGGGGGSDDSEFSLDISESSDDGSDGGGGASSSSVFESAKAYVPPPVRRGAKRSQIGRQSVGRAGIATMSKTVAEATARRLAAGAQPSRRAPVGFGMKKYPIRKSLVTQHAIERRGIQAGMAPVVLGAGHTKEARWQFQDPTACLKGESIYTAPIIVSCREKFEQQEADREQSLQLTLPSKWSGADGTMHDQHGVAKCLMPPALAADMGELPIFNMLHVLLMDIEIQKCGNSLKNRYHKVRQMLQCLGILVTQAINADELSPSMVADTSLHTIVQVARTVVTKHTADRFVKSMYNFFFGKDGKPQEGLKTSTAEDWLR